MAGVASRCLESSSCLWKVCFHVVFSPLGNASNLLRDLRAKPHMPQLQYDGISLTICKIVRPSLCVHYHVLHLRLWHPVFAYDRTLVYGKGITVDSFGPRSG